MDEKVVFVNGKKMYDLNCKDHITKYITAHLFVEKRTFQRCVEFLNQIKITSYQQILERWNKEKHKPRKKKKLITFVSDGFQNYRNAFNKLFFKVAKLTFGIPIRSKVLGLKHNNNAIERHNGKLKGRLQNMRRGFGSFEGAECFMNLNHIIHNFINPHQEIDGKTPAEVAGVNLKLGRNKLLNIIKYRAKSKVTKR